MDDTLKYWKPNAPDYKERLKALKYAHKKGYRTFVSLEPGMFRTVGLKGKKETDDI